MIIEREVEMEACAAVDDSDEILLPSFEGLVVQRPYTLEFTWLY